MPDNPEDKMGDDGVFGIDAMEKDVWKVDFKTSTLTLASSIDPFPEIGGAEIFPAKFDQHSINIEVDFGNNMVKTLAVDLGYNGEMLLPQSQFNRICPSGKRNTSAGTFDTPAGEKTVNKLWFFDSVKLGNNWFVTMVSSNETAKEYLVGLSFFKRFDYVIFNFINRRIYIPKKYGNLKISPLSAYLVLTNDFKTLAIFFKKQNYLCFIRAFFSAF